MPGPAVGFTCAVCGRFHEEEPRDVRLTFPEPVARLDEEERRRRVVAADDFCSLAEPSGAQRHFARGLLELPIRGEDAYFGYGAWVELDEAVIRLLAARWRDPAGAAEPPFRGRLANELAPYEGTEGLPASLVLGDVERLPRLEVDGAHRLVEDARGGITPARARELALTVLHGPR